nr:hypothetical protein [Lachnospiraceae bacterium]
AVNDANELIRKGNEAQGKLADATKEYNDAVADLELLETNHDSIDNDLKNKILGAKDNLLDIALPLIKEYFKGHEVEYHKGDYHLTTITSDHYIKVRIDGVERYFDFETDKENQDIKVFEKYDIDHRGTIDKSYIWFNKKTDILTTRQEFLSQYESLHDTAEKLVTTTKGTKETLEGDIKAGTAAKEQLSELKEKQLQADKNFETAKDADDAAKKAATEAAGKLKEAQDADGAAKKAATEAAGKLKEAQDADGVAKKAATEAAGKLKEAQEADDAAKKAVNSAKDLLDKAEGNKNTQIADREAKAAKLKGLNELKNLKDAALETAKQKKQEVSDALDKVVKAAEDLEETKKNQSEKEGLVNDLQAKYDAARAEYEAAKAELRKVQTKADAIQESINRMKAELNKIHVSHKDKSDDTSKNEETGSHETAPSTPGSGLTDISHILQGTDTAISGVYIEDTLGIFGGATAPVNNLAAATDTTTTNSVFNADTAEVRSGQTDTVVAANSADADLESDVLGERVAPIVKAAEDGTFTRDMLFNEDAKQIPIALWLLLLTFGAAGAGVYLKLRKNTIKVKADK